MMMRRCGGGGAAPVSVQAVVLAVLAVGSVLFVTAVDRSNFKTCEQSGFCKRQILDRPSDWTSPYTVERSSVEIVAGSDGNGQQQALVFDLKDSRETKLLRASIVGFESDTLRLVIDEKEPIRPRYRVQDVVSEDLVNTPAKIQKSDSSTDEHFVADVLVNHDVIGSIIVTYAPFRIDFMRGDTAVATVNGRGLFDFEQQRERRDGDVDGMWEESFKTHKDSKPHGPTAISLDLTFHDAQHVYGIPEHADSFALRDTERTKPYRLYNLDVFEYELEETMALYGSIPYMLGHSRRHTTGALLLNAAEMWVHVQRSGASSPVHTRLLRALSSLFSSPSAQAGGDGNTASRASVDTQWVVESGVVDLFVFLGPKPHDVFAQYAKVTGMPELPPLFSLAYHQCRWNYNDQEDVALVDRRLDEADIPADVIWLDIEHTDGKRYMTWDRTKFPDPAAMQNALNVKERKMVNIVDPHIKRASGYRVHEEAERLGLYVKNKDGNDYDGWCWPGSSSWLDFMNADVRSWWADQFALDKYEGTTQSVFFWNDMNEPSVFNGPEVTMHKDAKHLDGREHRDVHNIYGMWQPASTAEGIRRRSGGHQRPFVLSRAFFAGSQKYGAIWTGDNTAEWGHLKASVPMLLSVSVAGLPFCGADIGGFFGNPDTELLVRWYQAGAYQPFMRAHAHLDTKRREPYLLDEPEQTIVRSTIHARYQLLPYWYTLFHVSATTGVPVMRPIWAEYPEEEDAFAEETTHLVGGDLLVTPVTVAGATSASVYFPGSQPWYDVETGQSHAAPARKTVAAPLRKIPVFQRGGSIIPRKMRVRRTSGLTHHDPFTLVAALDSSSTAEGKLYVDDYNSYAYATGSKFLIRSFRIETRGSDLVFTSTADESSGEWTTDEWIERIRIHGVSQEPSAVTRYDGTDSNATPLTFTYNAGSKTLDIKKPHITSIAHDFTVVVAF